MLASASMPRDMITINKDRLARRIHALSQFGRDPEGGWSRFPFTPAYDQARDLVKTWMEEAGMAVRFDAAGNTIGRLEGANILTPVIAAGSHIDSVQNGGMYDGNVGVMAGLEAITAMAESGTKWPYPMELIIFNSEEGSRFGAGLFGSNCIAGKMTPEKLKNYVDPDGVSLWDAFVEAGLDPEKIGDCQPPKGYYKCYFEAHIEQAHVLDTEGLPMGIVEGIAAPYWLGVTLSGRSDHAGATPMNLRRDALIGAAMAIVEMEKIAKETGKTTVGTLGKLNVYPNAANIIPGRVEMTFDIRDINADREKAVERIKAYIGEICKERNLTYTMREVLSSTPALSAPYLCDIIEEAAKEAEIPYRRMISGAGHDAQLMAFLTDIAMIFTPSVKGLSHCPEEDTNMEDIVKCTQVLTMAMEKMQSS